MDTVFIGSSWRDFNLKFSIQGFFCFYIFPRKNLFLNKNIKTKELRLKITRKTFSKSDEPLYFILFERLKNEFKYFLKIDL
jgi:hypothetical protein